MTRITEEPTITTKKGSSGDEDTFSHPSYAMIGASRITGQSCLFGSDFVHNGYICVRVRRAVVRRSLSHDWYGSKGFAEDVVELNLSYAQWAEFVSSMNMGDGIPCTLSRVGVESIPEISDPKKTTEQFTREVDETLDDADKAIKKAMELLEGSGLSEKKKAEIRGAMSKARQEIGTNMEFVAKSFDKHMQKTVAKAKIEVNAYATSTVMRLGMEAISTGAALEFPSVKGDKAIQYDDVDKRQDL